MLSDHRVVVVTTVAVRKTMKKFLVCLLLGCWFLSLSAQYPLEERGLKRRLRKKSRKQNDSTKFQSKLNTEAIENQKHKGGGEKSPSGVSEKVFHRLKRKHGASRMAVKKEMWRQQRDAERKKKEMIKKMAMLPRPLLNFRKYKAARWYQNESRIRLLNEWSFSAHSIPNTTSLEYSTRNASTIYHSFHTREGLSPMNSERLFAPVEVGSGYSSDCCQNNDFDRDENWIIPKTSVNILSYPQCHLGLVRENAFILQNRFKHHRCTSRGMGDRKNLSGSWSDTDQTISKLLVNLAAAFDNSSDIINLVFLGDSISLQLTQAFLCDALREGLKFSSESNLTARARNYTLTKFKIRDGSNRSVLFRVHNKQFELPCDNIKDTGNETVLPCRDVVDKTSLSQKEIREFNRKTVYDFVSSLLTNFSTSSLTSDSSIEDNNLSRKTLILLNYGLHLNPQTKWQLWPMTSAIYDWGEKSRVRRENVPFGNSDFDFVFFRETSSQTFSFSEDGYYSKGVAIPDNTSEGFCCRFPLKNPFLNNWRNNDVRDYLNQLDPSWWKTVGWVPLFSETLQLYDMHLEYNPRKNVIDCTHFFYVPLLFASVWYDIEKALKILVGGLRGESSRYLSVLDHEKY